MRPARAAVVFTDPSTFMGRLVENLSVHDWVRVRATFAVKPLILKAGKDRKGKT